MTRTRSYRRHKYAVRKERVKRRYYTDPDADGKWLGFHAATPVPCSRYCCGNPRKWFEELTVQEMRAPRVDEEW